MILKLIAKCGASAMEPARHRADWDPEHRGSFVVAEASDVHEVDGLTQLRRQGAKRLFDAIVERRLLQDLFWAGARFLEDVDVGDITRSEHTWSAPSVPVLVGIAHDRQQPRSWVTAIERVDEAIGAEKCVLKEVLSLMVIAGDADRSTPERWDLRHDDRFESLSVKARVGLHLGWPRVR